MKSLLLLMLIAVTHAQLDMDKQLNFEDNIAEESQSDEQIFANAVTAKPILNDGKPFYVARDPTTGNLDFNMKKTVGLTNDIPVSRKDELSGNGKPGHDINGIGPNNFHDFLNLPVKYSSSKFVYPLISGSYANLKYQGNNKNHVSNHKNYSTTLGTTTQSPKFFTHITHPVRNEFTATFKHPETTAETFKVTTHRPTTHFTTSEKLKPSTAALTTEAPETTQSTTVKYSSTIVQNSFPSTFKNKYVDSAETRKKSTTATTTTKTTTPPADPVRFIDYDEVEDFDFIQETKETKPTTYRPPFENTRLSFSTSMPLLPSAFKPMPTEAPHNQTNKIVFETSPKNPSVMSLSEIINTFTGNDNLSPEQNAIPYETADSSQVEVRKPAPLPKPSSPPSPPHKTLQQQLHNQQKPLNFAPPTGHVGFPDEQLEDYVEFENPEDQRYANQYVKYEVQKPSVDLVKFKQVPSMNNVVISPGQNSASFVLGSQQSVGSVGVGSSLGVGSSHFADNSGPIKQGQVINDDPPVRPGGNPISNQMQASIRFPSESVHDFDNAPIVKGTIKIDGNEVQPPQALSQNHAATKKPLIFPANTQSGSMSADVSFGMPAPTSTSPSQIIFENVNDIYEKINDKRQKQEIVSNENSNKIAAGELTPPQVLTPPGQNQPRPYNRPPPHQQFNGRRPSGPNRPNIPGLPNILPQFRPNAKASHGHPMMYKDVGAIRVPVQGVHPYANQGPNPYQGQPILKNHPNPNQYPPRQYPAPKVGLPPMGPPQLHQSPNPNVRLVPTRQYVTRISGPSNPSKYPIFEQNLGAENRRLFRVPPPQPQMNDFTYMKPPPFTPPGFQIKRYQNTPETLQMQQRPTNSPQAPDFELNKSSPPQALTQLPPKPIDSEEDTNSTRLEPVITLQMLQHKKNGGSGKLNLPAVPHDIPQDLGQGPIPSNHKEDTKKPSVYVVYPVSADDGDLSSGSQRDETVIAGSDPKISEYQNTPFSVVSHFEQEPLLMKKDKKKNQFPYHLERPAQASELKATRPTYAPYGGSVYNIGEEPSRPTFEYHESPISSKLTRVTEKPIAIAYTPTEPNRSYPPPTKFYHGAYPQYSHFYDSKFSPPNYGGPVISDILDEKHLGFDYYHKQQQLQQHLNNGEDLDFYKQHYDFEAPFQASVSLNPEVTNPYEGWSIVTQSTDSNKIDRADLNVVESSDELTTKKYDPQEFQPVFESGFQPIYSERKVSTAPELFDDSGELSSPLPLIDSTHSISTSTTPLPSTTSIFETSSQMISSEEHPSTPKTDKKKPKVEIDSLEAFFESLTRDYDDDESTNKSENESRSL